jgi:hypothetical protein
MNNVTSPLSARTPPASVTEEGGTQGVYLSKFLLQHRRRPNQVNLNVLIGELDAQAI